MTLNRQSDIDPISAGQLWDALEGGKTAGQIIADRIQHLTERADTLDAGADIYPARSSRRRELAALVARLDAKAYGLSEAWTIVTTAMSRDQGDPGSTAYWTSAGRAIRPGATAAEAATTKGDPK